MTSWIFFLLSMGMIEEKKSNQWFETHASESVEQNSDMVLNDKLVH